MPASFSNYLKITIMEVKNKMQGMQKMSYKKFLLMLLVSIKDPEAKRLANDIITAQKKEIAEMKAILKRMEK